MDRIRTRCGVLSGWTAVVGALRTADGPAARAGGVPPLLTGAAVAGAGRAAEDGGGGDAQATRRPATATNRTSLTEAAIVPSSAGRDRAGASVAHRSRSGVRRAPGGAPATS